MEFRILGSLEVRAGGEVLRLGAQRQQALLAALLLSANRVVTMGRLVDAVWGEDPPASAAANLRTHVNSLRRRLTEAEGGPARLETRPGGYLITVSGNELDLLAFEELAAQGNQARKNGQHALAAQRFGEALVLWRGEPLENITVFGDCQADQLRLAEARLTVLEGHCGTRLELGEHAELVAELRGLVTQYPLREQFWILLLLALYGSGRQADALAAYQDARTALADEAGVDPGPELQATHARILAGDATLARPVSAARYTLARDISDFTGRGPELDRVLAGEPDGVWTIDGMAGIGKTALAVHAAHRLAARYPDGQLFLDLRAHTPGDTPLTASTASEKLLRAWGIPGERIPAEADERTELWHSELAGRKVLLVFDNALTAAQVRPLLPTRPGCLVLVTSRRRLVGLDNADLISLDVLPQAVAVELFGNAVGDARAATEPDAVKRAVALCGYLPLAIRIAAARLRHRPTWNVGYLADRLEDEQRRLTELRAEEHSVAAAFALSYQDLDPDQGRLFRLLGLAPGTDLDAHAAAALTAQPLDEAERLLEDLLDVHLLQQRTQSRYRFHDLLRAFAVRQTQEEDSEADRRAAMERLLTFYLHTAHNANLHLAQSRPAFTPEFSAMALEFTSRHDAMRWCDTERPNIVAAAIAAEEAGFTTHTWQFPLCVSGFFYLRKHLADWITTCRLALRKPPAPNAEAMVLNALGTALRYSRQLGEAAACFHRSATLHHELGNRLLEGNALLNLSDIYQQLGRFDEALDCQGRAIENYRSLGNRSYEAIALTSFGETHLKAGNLEEALNCHLRAIAIHRETGNKHVEARALNSLIETYRKLGRFDQVIELAEQALAVLREVEDRAEAADTLNHLGDALSHNGQPARAVQCWREALAIYEEFNDPQAAEIRARLAEVAATHPRHRVV